MKKQLSLVLILVMLVMAMGMAPQVQAAQSAFKSPINPGATTFRYKGDVANAYFSSTTDGCIYTDLSVFAGDVMSKAGPGAPATGKSVNLSLYRYDSCSGTWLSFAYGSALVDDTAFQVDKKLRTAHLQSTVSMYDWEGALFDLAVDLTWTGTGDVSRSKSSSQYQSNGCKITYRYSGASRPASVSGSISDGVNNYAATGSMFAELQSVKGGEVVMGCGL